MIDMPFSFSAVLGSNTISLATRAPNSDFSPDISVLPSPQLSSAARNRSSLGAEISADQGRIDAHVAGDVAHPDVVIALGREPFACSIENGRARRGGVFSGVGRDITRV